MSGVEVRRSESRDGCQCPPWTLHCVHFGGQILVLSDYDIPAPHTCGLRVVGGGLKRFKVVLTNGYKLCREGEECLVPMQRWANTDLYWSDDLPAAEAEFERRAEELRQAPVEEAVDA